MIRIVSPTMPVDISVHQMNRRHLLLARSMLALIVTVWGYLFVQHAIEESGSRTFPAMAHINLREYFVVAAVFLFAPFVGACSAARLTRSPERPAALEAWLMLAAFLLCLVMSGFIYWSDYRHASRP